MAEAVIVAMARSAIGRANKGSLVEMRPDDLLAQMVSAALAQVPQLNPRDIDDLMVGTSSPAGESGHNIARVVAVLLGMDHLPGVTVNRYCSSSLQTTRMALHAIRAGEGEIFVSGGVETVSRYHHGTADFMPNTANPKFTSALARTRTRAEDSAAWIDPRQIGELPDIYIAMGQTAENVAESLGISRAEQDEFAVRSQVRAQTAIENGFWAQDITPVTLPNGSVVSQDDGPRPNVTLAAVAQLQPVFRPGGTVTAGNCCPLNDGAAALVIMSDTAAERLGITPLARIVATGVSALSPEVMGMGPVEATQQVLQRAGMTMSDIDLVEINEAFAAQVIPSARQLGIDDERLNINGGAIAVGHPFGMTGARITSTLVNSLRFYDQQVGLVTMCVGGGQGMAMIVERMS